MTFMESVRTCFDKILTIDGRARRSEFWYFALFVWIVSFILNLIFKDGNIVARLITLVLNVATITVSIRRLHDVGKSGFWLLLELVPIIGWAILIYFYVQDSMPGRNQYGENPKGIY